MQSLFCSFIMRYHFEEPKIFVAQFAKTYECDHVVYNRCTLYKIRDRGLAVIQQRYDPDTKHTYWTEIDESLVDVLYLHPKFHEVFNKLASEPKNGLYPTITVRQLMWKLRIKPIKRARWESCFDHKNI